MSYELTSYCWVSLNCTLEMFYPSLVLIQFLAFKAEGFEGVNLIPADCIWIDR